MGFVWHTHMSQAQTNTLRMNEVRHTNGQGAQKHFSAETQMTVPWLLQMSHETSVGPHAVKSCQGWTCHGGLKYGNHLFAFCACGLVEDKTKQESHCHKALTTPWCSSLATLLTLLYSTAGWCGLQESYSRVIQQIQSLLVGNVKSPNGRDPVTIDCLPQAVTLELLNHGNHKRCSFSALGGLY